MQSIPSHAHATMYFKNQNGVKLDLNTHLNTYYAHRYRDLKRKWTQTHVHPVPHELVVKLERNFLSFWLLLHAHRCIAQSFRPQLGEEQR